MRGFVVPPRSRVIQLGATPTIAGGVDATIVPALGRTVWNPGIYEGIPTDSSSGRADGAGGATQHGSTISAGAGLLSTIQAALDGAGAAATKSARKFVLLGAGNFTGLNGTLVIPAFVILRGTMNANGYTRDTVLRFSVTASGMINFRDNADLPQSQGDWGTIRSITTPTTKDAATITVDNASNFNVGDIIQIDTLRDGTANGALPIVYDPPNNGEWCWTGDVGWFMRLTASSISEYPNSAGGHRPVSELHEILAKNGNVLTVYDSSAAVIKGSPCRSPMYRTPEAYLCRGTSSDVNRFSGLEDLKIEPSSTNGNTVISMNQCAFCWVKNVEIYGDSPNTTFTGPGVWMQIGGQCYRNEVTGCYFHGFDDYGPGGAYGIRLQGSENYIHNNILIQASKPVQFEHSSGGNVVAYNYVDECHLANGWQELGIGTHAAFVHYELVEGNWSPNFGPDATHGNNGWLTYFRNYGRGSNSSTGVNPPSSGPMRAMNVGGWMREMYCIGNVLLDPDLADNVVDFMENPETPFDGFTGRCVYLMGWAPVLLTTSGNADEWDDGESGRNFHRHLDYDSYTASQYDNSTNPVKSLPNSLHRSTAPSYFSGYTWPWIVPSAGSHATRVLTLPAKARYDGGTA